MRNSRTRSHRKITTCRLSPDENMNTGRNSKPTCLCRDTGGKGTLPAQRTGFNTLDNWGHKTPTQSKRKRTGKKRLKGHGPEHVYNTLGYIPPYSIITSVLAIAINKTKGCRASKSWLLRGTVSNALEKSSIATSVCFPEPKFLHRSWRVIINWVSQENPDLKPRFKFVRILLCSRWFRRCLHMMCSKSLHVTEVSETGL